MAGPGPPPQPLRRSNTVVRKRLIEIKVRIISHSCVAGVFSGGPGRWEDISEKTSSAHSTIVL